MKKIVFVIPSLVGGGAERVVKHLINYLNPAQYDVYVIIFAPPSVDWTDSVKLRNPILSLNKKSRWDFLKMVFRLRRLFKDIHPDIVMSFLDFTNIMTVLATLGVNRNFKLILNERNYPSQHLRHVRLGWLKRIFVKFAYQKADRVLCNSRMTKKSLAKEYGVTNNKIETIYNPIVLDDIKMKALERIDYPLQKNRTYILGVGRLNQQKRFDVLLKAFALLKKKMPTDLSLIILGEGKLKDRLHQLANRLQIKDDVYFAGYQDNPYAWLARADVFVLSSDYEGFPNVILEAMASGTPVVSTNCPSGPNEIIENGVNGLLVTPGDEHALAEAVFKLLNDKNMRAQFIEKARQKIEDFKIERILPQYELEFETEKYDYTYQTI